MFFNRTKQQTLQLENLYNLSERIGVKTPLSRDDANSLISASDPKGRQMLIMMIIDLIFDLIMERFRK